MSDTVKKFRIQVKTLRGKASWWEKYEVATESPEAYAQEILAFFNKTLKPFEEPRVILSVEMLEDTGNIQHTFFKKTDGMSVEFRGETVDLMQCSECGITGKRFGLQPTVKLDSKWSKKCYRFCNTAKEALGRCGGKIEVHDE